MDELNSKLAAIGERPVSVGHPPDSIGNTFIKTAEGKWMVLGYAGRGKLLPFTDPSYSGSDPAPALLFKTIEEAADWYWQPYSSEVNDQ